MSAAVDKGNGALTNAARIILGALAVACAVGAVAAFAAGIPLVPVEGAIGAVVFGLTAAYEHGRYRAQISHADAGRFQRTDEVFTDPTTGQLTRVWFDPATGSRDYRPDA